MKKPGSLAILFILLTLFAALSGLTSAQELPEGQLMEGEEKSSQRIEPAKSNEKVAESLSQGRANRFNLQNLEVQLDIPTPNYYKNATEDEACFQLLANTSLQVVEFGDGFGSAEPWVTFFDIVYYSGIEYVSADYSLFLRDADWIEGISDSSPQIDAFAQGFFMPEDLSYVVIEYNTATLQTNNSDQAFGDIYPIEPDGTVNLNEVSLLPWTINNSDGEWQGRFVEIIDEGTLQSMEGKPLAIVLSSFTDDEQPGEDVYFDDISVIACFEVAPPPQSGTVFLPNIMNNFGKASGPICSPPTENPQDEYNKNRGLVQTGAECSSTLSSIDRADYYAYTPTQSGNHTLHLTDLKQGTEWAAMMFFDTASPSYVPGPTAGDCRIGIGGSGDKSVTCPLTKDVPLIVKVSAGSTPVQGPYTMKITRP